MNDLLVSLALVISLIGFVGLVKRLEPLNRSRWAGAGLMAAGLTLALVAGTRSDDGSEPGTSHMLLDDFMPEYDFTEIHAIRISAPPSRIYQAMKDVSLRDVGGANVLFWIRSLPNRLSGRPAPSSDGGNPLFTTEQETKR